MWRQDITQEISLISVMEPVDTGNIATPKYSSAFDMRGYPGQRFMAICRAALSLTGAVSNGVTFSLQDTDDDGAGAPVSGDWAANANVNATLALITAVGIQKIAFWPKEGGAERPWVRIKALSNNNSTLFSVSAAIIVIAAGA